MISNLTRPLSAKLTYESSVVDRHRFAADADPNPNFHLDANPDQDPTPSFSSVSKMS
jgi:hypothetical protein